MDAFTFRDCLLQIRKQKLSLHYVADLSLSRIEMEKLQDLRLEKLTQAFWSVIDAVEAEGQYRCALDQELLYHNRLHISEALTALSCFLSIDTNLTVAEKLLAMIAMAGHDYSYQRKLATAIAQPQEILTANLICQMCLKNITMEDKSRVYALIKGTQYKCVIDSYEAFLLNPSDSYLLAQVLINEADIAASLLPELSLTLTSALMIERGDLDLTETKIQATYCEFKNATKLLSPSALKLLQPLVTAKHD
jgi:hypothetical protein